jgi:exodeoxyribonuclease V gamma subunit
VEALGELLARPVCGPLETEPIVVANRGMAVWLSMQLARRFGVWSGAEFPFPRRFIARMLHAVVGERAASLALDERERLLWTVLPQLETLIDAPAFAELRNYCREDPTGIARFQLARQVATLFDEYLVHRPELVLGWEHKGDEWQAELWRAVVAKRGPDHFAGLQEAFFAAIARATERPPGLPPRVAVFGVSTLPPILLRMLSALSRWIDVHMFVLSPSKQWWAGIRSHREVLRELRRASPESLPALDEGNPLLASLGAVGREFQAVLEAEADYVEPTRDLYVDPAHDSALAVVQSDLLQLRWRGRDVLGRSTAPPFELRDDDESIAVFACHSRLREVEVLHDRLLDLLARDPTLQPRDIVVLATDVDTYAPLVEAVFERDRSDATLLPYCIADRSARAESPTLEAWSRILALVGGRTTASEVLDLLVLEPVQLRLGIAPDDVDTIARWVAESGIRWGIDGRHRKRHGQPMHEEATWRFGLRRLLLGWALPTARRELFAGVLPYDEIEGQRGDLLGRFVEFCERLFALAAALEKPRSPRAWQTDLEAVIADLLAPRADAQWELDELRSAIEAVADAAEAAGFADDIALPAFHEAVLDKLGGDRPARGFMSGGVTVCGLQPMRAIPFRVVAIVGLGDTDFPRSSPPLAFDLVRASPRLGDRSRRADDRYVFLEAVLSCRQHLVLGYVGQSSQDDRDLPPSVVLAEFLDALDDAFVIAGDDRPDAVRRRLVVRQPMQPFSPRAFGASDDPRLFSYARPWLEGARALVGQRPTDAGAQRRAPLFLQRLPAPEAEDGPIRLDRLVRFFQNPLRELLRRRLDVNLQKWEDDIGDREPMELDGLQTWRLGDELLRLLGNDIDGVASEQAFALLRGGGGLPIGSVGKALFDDLTSEVGRIVETLRLRRSGNARVVEIDLRVPGRDGEQRIVGRLADLDDRGRLIARFTRPRAKHQLTLWIEHLVLCAAQPDPPPTSTMIGRVDARAELVVLELEPVPDPTERLADLVELHRIGLREPLLLFPDASMAFAECFRDTGDPAAALAAARKQLRTGERLAIAKPELHRVFGDDDVFAPGYSPFADAPLESGGFMELACRVFGPLLQARRSS